MVGRVGIALPLQASDITAVPNRAITDVPCFLPHTPPRRATLSMN